MRELEARLGAHVPAIDIAPPRGSNVPMNSLLIDPETVASDDRAMQDISAPHEVPWQPRGVSHEPSKLMLRAHRRDSNGVVTDLGVEARGQPAIVALAIAVIIAATIAVGVRAKQKDAQRRGPEEHIEHIERIERVEHIEHIEHIECDGS